MLNAQDFDHYQLESLLDQSKHKIDTADPEKQNVLNVTVNTLKSLSQYRAARHFEDKYIKHGMSDNLIESFTPTFEKVGLDTALMTKQKPSELTNATLNYATDTIKNFNTVVIHGTYLPELSNRLRKVERLVTEIFLDEQTTYQHVDLVAFANTKISGYTQETYSQKLKGMQILLGALNTYQRFSYESQPLRISMRWHLLQAGFSFDDQLVVAPKDDEVIVTDTLEHLGWTPSKVNDLNSTLDSVMTIERNLDVLTNIMPSTEAISATKMTATLVENCYNVRNILSYIKNTLFTMCNQYLTMVRSYQ